MRITLMLLLMLTGCSSKTLTEAYQDGYDNGRERGRIEGQIEMLNKSIHETNKKTDNLNRITTEIEKASEAIR